MKIIFVVFCICFKIYFISAICDFDIEDNYASFHKQSLTYNYKNFKRECKKLYNRAQTFRDRAPDECFDSVRESKRFKSLMNMLDLLCHLSRHQKQIYFNQKSFHCMAEVVMDSETCEEQKEKPHKFCEHEADKELLECLNTTVRTKCELDDDDDFIELFKFIFEYSRDRSLCSEDHLILGFLGMI